MQYRSSPPMLVSTIKRHRQHVPLNRQGVPNTDMDSLVYKSLHQDLMKFSAKLNSIYGWKSQTEEAQDCLRERIADLYEFDGPMSLSDNWLSSEIIDGIRRHKFRLRTLIRGGHQKPPKVKLLHWDALVELESAPETLEQSARMQSITQGRPPKGYSAKALEKSVIAALVSSLHASTVFIYNAG
jgi:hypothetical protein